MKTALVLRFVCVAVLWLMLCYYVLSCQPITLWVLFWVVASGVIVFVPMYKKYVKNGKWGKSK